MMTILIIMTKYIGIISKYIILPIILVLRLYKQQLGFFVVEY